MINVRSAWDGRNCWKRFVCACLFSHSHMCLSTSNGWEFLLFCFLLRPFTQPYVVSRPPALAHNCIRDVGNRMCWQLPDKIILVHTHEQQKTAIRSKFGHINQMSANKSEYQKHKHTHTKRVARIRKRAAWHDVRLCATYCGRDANKSARALSIIGATVCICVFVCVCPFTRSFVTTCYACTHDNVGCMYTIHTRPSILLRGFGYAATEILSILWINNRPIGFAKKNDAERLNEGEF